MSSSDYLARVSGALKQIGSKGGSDKKSDDGFEKMAEGVHKSIKKVFSGSKDKDKSSPKYDSGKADSIG